MRQAIEHRTEVNALAYETRVIISTLRKMNKENHYAERLEIAFGGGGN